MRNPKMVNRIAALFALFIILFQTFAFPVAAAQPWSGKSWKGESWEGDSWKGDSWKGDTWEGDTWTSDPWEGKTWNGSSWEGDSWNQNPGQGGNGWNGSNFKGRDFNGSDFNGSDFNGSDFSGSDFNGSDFNGSDFNGSDFNGNPWNNPGYNGNSWNAPGYNGNQWNAPGYNGNPWNNPNYNGNPWNTPGYYGNQWNIPGYNGLGPGGGGGAGDSSGSDNSSTGPSVMDVTEFILDDYIGGKISMIDAYNGGSTSFGPTGSYLTGLMLNGVKMGLGERTPWYVNAASDATDIYDKGKGVYDAGKTIRDIRRLESLGETVTRGASTASAVGTISKLSAVGAGISAGFSAYDTVLNTMNAVDVWKSDASKSDKVAATADATGSLGETLFNVGAVASAIPGGQAVGAGLMIAGGVVWGASKITKFFADGTASKVWNKTKDVASNVWNKTSGFFKGLFGK
ncbi:Uncharacterized protein conserved in bacteria [Bacillus freudenreichii]|nr:Uncharacterized protein conserved in bacteria [Bacillus freudenreichii]